MHPDHPALAEALKARARPASHGLADFGGYVGSIHPCLNVPVPDRRRIARAWIAAHRQAAPQEVLALAHSLMEGPAHEEKTLAAILLGAHRKALAAATPQHVDRWLGRLSGWAEVDTLCQNLFPPEQLTADWPAWSALIERLSRHADIDRRRASLVLLTGPARRSPDPRFAELGFRVIEQLKAERAVLITKAVSWLLRALATHHAPSVAAYLQAEAATLPAIAVRETRAKLATGRKTPRR